jgi:uncharacterized membrane protein
MNEETMCNGVQHCEEMIGGHKFQVSRLVINASPNQVQNVLTDYDRVTQMFCGVKKCQVLEDNGQSKKIAFTATAPGNLWTFDYVLEVKEFPGYIEWHRVSGAFKLNEGFWKLEPLEGGHATLVTYAKFVDGGLLMPSMLVNRELKASMPQVLANLKTSAESSGKVARIEAQSRTH